jgi:uncharacterized membrane protein required for colicin V production
MRVTFFDVLFMLGLVGGAAWGFYRGTFRQAATTVVIYVSTIVSTVSYRGLSRMLGSSTEQSATATDMLSFIILMVVTNVLLALITNDLLSHIEIDRMRIWVNFGGMIFGFINAAIWCSMILMILRSATSGEEWFGYEGVQQFFINQTRGSWMAFIFRPFMRFLLTIIRPFMFGRDLPPLLLYAL